MIGSFINIGGILLGGGIALLARKSISIQYQARLKVILGAFTVWFGLKLTWENLNGSFLQIIKLLSIVLLAMVLGKLIGRLMHLQKLSNALGQFASHRIIGANTSKDRFNDGFLTCTALFCAAPLATLASVQEGLSGSAPVFCVKAAMDGAATLAFAAMFGWGVLFSAIPVLAFQGLITRAAALAGPFLHNQPWPLAESVCATDGLLIFCVALVILQLKKIEIADYFPSLILAPILTRWLW